MATMTIRNLDDQLKARLRVQAVHDRSMEDEARDILRAALSVEPARPILARGVYSTRIEPWAVLNWSCRTVRLSAPRQPLTHDRPRHQRAV